MSAERADRQDQLLASLLAAYDDSLTENGPAPSLDNALAQDETLARRYHQARECLEMLDRARRIDGAFEPFQPALPRQIGRFEIQRQLGCGGLGVVYLARDPQLDRLVALKVPRGELVGDVDLERRFLREAAAAARFDHPNLVTLYKVGRDGSICFLVSEYVAGPTLGEWLKARPSGLEPREAAQLIRPLAEAVHHAHSRGVLHRDIKPSNVLLEANPQSRDDAPLSERLIPKLTDFGMAKLLGHATDDTRTGAILGTPAYMAPEQANGRTCEIDARTDVYALGAMLYELLTGVPPYRGASDIDTLRQLLLEEPLRPRSYSRAIPRDLEAICLKCLDKHSSGRYPSAKHLAEDLARFCDGEPTVARPPGPAGRLAKWARRRPAMAALATVILSATMAQLITILGYNARLGDEVARADAARDRALQEVETSRKLLYAADVRLASEALKVNNVSQALDLLDRHLPKPGKTDMREFAWLYLRGRCEPETQFLVGHEGSVFCVAWSPDSKRVGTAGEDRTARIWDSQNGQVLHVLNGHTDEVTCVAFSPDGQTIASGSEDGTVRLWSVATGEQLLVLTGHTDHVLTIAFADGNLLASGGRDRTVRIWDVKKGEQLKVLDDGLDAVRSVQLSPKGDCIFTADEEGAVTCWTFPQGMRRSCMYFPSGRQFALAMRPDGQRLAAAGRLGVIHAWDPQAMSTHAEHWEWPTSTAKEEHVNGHRGWIQTLAFAPKGNQLVSGGKDGVIQIWQSGADKPQRSLLGHRGRVWSVAWSPNGQRLASAAADSVRIWNSPNAPPAAAFPQFARLSNNVDTAPDGEVLVSLTQGNLAILDPVSHLQLETLRTDRGGYHTAHFSPDGAFVASRGTRSTEVWKRPNFEPQIQFPVPYSSYLALAWSPVEHVLATSGEANGVALMDVDQGVVRAVLPHDVPVRRIAFTADGDRLITLNQAFHVWDLKTNRLEFRLPISAWYMAIVPHSSLVAVADDTHVRIIDLATRQVVSTLNIAAAVTVDLAIDETTLFVLTDKPAAVTLWDLRTNQILIKLDIDEGNPKSMALSRDRNRLLVLLNDAASSHLHEWKIRRER